MRLNNRGWGLSNMIGLVIVLILFVIILFILSYNYGIEKGSPNDIYEEFIS